MIFGATGRAPTASTTASASTALRVSTVAGLFNWMSTPLRSACLPKMIYEIRKFTLERPARRGQQPSTQPLTRFYQRDARAALRRDACGFKAGRTAADHQHMLACPTRRPSGRQFVADGRVDHAFYFLARHRRDPALVAGDAGNDVAAKLSGALARPIRVGGQRARQSDDVGLAGSKGLLGHRGIGEAAAGHGRDRADMAFHLCV